MAIESPVDGARMRFASPDSDAEWREMAALLGQAFAMSAERWPNFREVAGPENFRGLWGVEGLRAALTAYDVGQWFSGRRLRMAAYAAVGVAAEWRFGGAGTALMEASLREQRAAGVPIASLYASTQPFYRRIGFQQAGSRYVYEASTRDLPRGAHDLQAHPVSPEDWPLALHERVAETQNGALARHEGFWRRQARSHSGVFYAWHIGDPQDPEGWLVLYQDTKTKGGRLFVQDRFAATDRASRRIWTLLADHRSMFDTVRWIGPANDADLLSWPEQTWEVREAERWMLRILDVAGALAGRGYRCDGSVVLRIQDEMFPDNEGAWTLGVEGGKASVRRGGEGGLALHVRDLAPLFSGLFSATELARAGRLEGDTSAADRLFAADEPWTNETW